MKLLRADLYGFGSFYQRSFSFQDGIHVLYGPNEAGKSTLHAFLGCMLFGLERGRGRAARHDLYSRYLPWEHEGTYGGSLAFESGEEECLLERSFLPGRRSVFLTTPGQGRLSCPDAAALAPYYEGLTEELYYNTLSVRQLRCPVGSSLTAELTRHFQDIRQAGVSPIRYETAQAWLKAEKKKLESRLTPGLERQIEEKARTAAAWEEALQDLSFLQEMQVLEEQIAHCMGQMEAFAKEGAWTEEAADDAADEAAEEPGRKPSRRPAFCLFFPAALSCLPAALFLFEKGLTAAALAAAAAAAVFLLAARLGRKRQAPPRPQNEIPVQKLQGRIKALQQQYQAVCRREWEHERLAEQAQELDDERSALKEQAAAEAGIRLELQAVGLALSALQRASGRMEGQIGPHLNAAMSEIFAGLTGGAYRQVYVNDKLEIAVRAAGRTIPLESLSQGTVEQAWLALRLAAIDIAFPQGGMPLLLDDCFLAYDDERLSHTLLWLAENYSGQVFLFTCQKREAALLEKERIPFTLIAL